MFRNKNKALQDKLIKCIYGLDNLCPIGNDIDIIHDKENTIIGCSLLDEKGELKTFVFGKGSCMNNATLVDLTETVLRVRNKYKHGKQTTTKED